MLHKIKWWMFRGALLLQVCLIAWGSRFQFSMVNTTWLPNHISSHHLTAQKRLIWVIRCNRCRATWGSQTTHFTCNRALVPSTSKIMGKVSVVLHTLKISHPSQWSSNKISRETQFRWMFLAEQSTSSLGALSSTTRDCQVSEIKMQIKTIRPLAVGGTDCVGTIYLKYYT